NGVDLRLTSTNIIVRNLPFTVTPLGTNDGITIDGGGEGTGHNIWIDHCTVSNALDGSMDMTKGADDITLSWNKYIYGPKATGNTHEYVNLIGSSDSDGSASQLFHVTIHHCWYGTNCVERMPSVRWGRVHVFNNYYTCSGNNYCTRTRISSQVLVENSFFVGAGSSTNLVLQNPWERFVT